MLGPKEEEIIEILKVPYNAVMGGLMYAITIMRLDSHVVGLVSNFQSNLGKEC